MPCTLAEERVEHEGDNSQPMEVGESGGGAFVVATEAAEACRPGEGTFEHPAPRQQHKAAFGFRQFDHDTLYPTEPSTETW